MATRCIDYLIEEAQKPEPAGAFIGLQGGQVQFTSLEDYPRMIDKKWSRPKNQWWMELRPIARVLAQLEPRASVVRRESPDQGGEIPARPRQV